MHAFFHIFAFTSFFMNRKKNSLFYKKKSGARSLFVCSEPESSRAIFESKKREKTCKNTFSKYIWAPKMLQKSSFFHQKWASRFQCKLFIFHRYLYVNGPKNMCKNRSFFHSKFMFFSTAKSSFSPFSVYRWSTKVEQIM